MTYSEARDYLLQQLPMFQRVGAAAYRADLTNITALCRLLNNPQQQLKCIHVAGTNGKGSVTHMIASVLQAAGYTVGVFVSPHYKDYRERIKVNGQYISKKFVADFVKDNKSKFSKINASFFEISTAMCFQYFKEKKVDFAVIETGMGGRLDSTNIIQPILSVITNISFDHQQFLGDTLEKIAGEKAGIIKPKTPVVIGETHAETKSVFTTTANKLSSPIVFADKVQNLTLPKCDLEGDYQAKNLRTALVAIHQLQKNGTPISSKNIKHGFAHVSANTKMMGRWMVMNKKPLVIYDSAHNEAGIKQVVEQLKKIKHNKLHWVYGTVADKDISPILKLLPKTALYYFCKAKIPRALPANDLQKMANGYQLKGQNFKSVKTAYRAAIENASPNDLVLVAGSVFIVAEVL